MDATSQGNIGYATVGGGGVGVQGDEPSEICVVGCRTVVHGVSIALPEDVSWLCEAERAHIFGQHGKGHYHVPHEFRDEAAGGEEGAHEVMLRRTRVENRLLTLVRQCDPCGEDEMEVTYDAALGVPGQAEKLVVAVVGQGPGCRSLSTGRVR